MENIERLTYNCVMVSKSEPLQWVGQVIFELFASKRLLREEYINLLQEPKKTFSQSQQDLHRNMCIDRSRKSY